MDASDLPLDWEPQQTAFGSGLSVSSLIARLSDAQFKLLFAMRRGVETVGESAWTTCFNRAMLEDPILRIGIAKWLIGRVIGTHKGVDRTSAPQSDLLRGLALLDDAVATIGAVRDALDEGRRATIQQRAPLNLVDSGSGCVFVDDIPVVPSICPIIVLQGSSEAMGQQYAEQIIEIFGSKPFAQFQARSFDNAETAVLHRWRDQVALHTPEFLPFFAGWAKGATLAGVAMSVDQVMAMWTTYQEPAYQGPSFGMAASQSFAEALYAGRAVENPPVDHVSGGDLCSGCCAWNDATIDGNLYAAATTDHDCFLQATIVAYPDDGHAFIYTPFSINGWLPALGSQTFAGLPGMNAAGLAYVHHGGGCHFLEPKATWGYGVRRGLSTFHILRYCSTAVDARDQELRWPIGDVGGLFGAPGGFYADRRYGYVLEGRIRSSEHPKGIIRESTTGPDHKSLSLLYANNNALNPAAGSGHCAPSSGYEYTLQAGWYTLDPAKITLGGNAATTWHRWWTKASEGRNRFHYKYLTAAAGTINLDWLLRFYRTPGEYPEVADWQELSEAYQSGLPINGSPANRGNAFVALMAPRANGDGLYMGCVGPARHALPPKDAGHGFYYYDETNSFWTIQLAPSALAMLSNASCRAAADIQAAQDLASAPSFSDWHEFRLNIARDQYGLGKKIMQGSDFGDAASLGRALRAVTRAQVRARQVTDHLAKAHPDLGIDKMRAPNGTTNVYY